MDEKVMMMEQDRLAKEKKRKKNRKKVWIASAVITTIMVVGVWYLGWGRYLGKVQESTVQITTTTGQRIVYAGLISVKGNEITYQVARERSVTADEAETEEVQKRSEMSDMEGGEGMRGGRGGRGGEMPERSGEMPERSGEMPERSGEMPERSGEMPQMPDRGQMEGGFPNMSQMGGGMPGFGNGMLQNGVASSAVSKESFTYDETVYELTEETVTTLIPVGTDVTTKLGTVTTFSRLAAGDKVALVVEEDGSEQIITSVYIID